MPRATQAIDSSDDAESDHDDKSDSESGSELLDMEARDDAYESEEVEVDEFFTPFLRLPIELRHRIWELFCPDLFSRGRVLHFEHDGTHLSGISNGVSDHIALQDQTEGLRRVMAVHHESRGFGLKAFPGTLRMHFGSPNGLVRFNEDKDIVYMSSKCMRMHDFTIWTMPGFSKNIRHLAVDCELAMDDLPKRLFDAEFFSTLPQLQTIYLSQLQDNLPKGTIRWCGSPMVRHCLVETYEKELGLGEDLAFMYSWPDLERHPDFAKVHIPPDAYYGLDENLRKELEDKGVRIAPMVTFELEEGMSRFDRLVEEHDAGLADNEELEEWTSSDEEDELPDPGDYESDGINDGEVLEIDATNSLDELLDDGSPEPEVEYQDTSIVVLEDGSSDPEEIDPPDEAPDAQFSDLESEGSQDSAPIAPRGTRRRVVDSDDEEDEPPAKRVRKTPAPVVSDVDEEESHTAGSAGSAQVISSDDEDDEPQQDLPLHVRLAMARNDNPIPDDDEDEESDESDLNSYGAGEASQSEEEDDEDGMMDRFAEESDGQGEAEDGSDDEEPWQ